MRNSRKISQKTNQNLKNGFPKIGALDYPVDDPKIENPWPMLKFNFNLSGDSLTSQISRNLLFFFEAWNPRNIWILSEHSS